MLSNQFHELIGWHLRVICLSARLPASACFPFKVYKVLAAFSCRSRCLFIFSLMLLIRSHNFHIPDPRRRLLLLQCQLAILQLQLIWLLRTCWCDRSSRSFGHGALHLKNMASGSGRYPASGVLRPASSVLRSKVLAAGHVKVKATRHHCHYTRGRLHDWRFGIGNQDSGAWPEPEDQSPSAIGTRSRAESTTALPRMHCILMKIYGAGSELTRVAFAVCEASVSRCSARCGLVGKFTRRFSPAVFPPFSWPPLGRTGPVSQPGLEIRVRSLIYFIRYPEVYRIYEIRAENLR